MAEAKMMASQKVYFPLLHPDHHPDFFTRPSSRLPSVDGFGKELRFYY
jgi:hypothetical protein